MLFFNKSQYPIVFFGTPEFAVPILEKLAGSPYRPTLVITQADKPAGRKQELTPPPVKVAAGKLAIPIVQQATRKELIDILRSDSPVLFVVVAYGKILPKEVLGIPKYGTLNVHPSLLPKWRGPSPIQYAILNGDAETGVSIMLLDEEMDHGPILEVRRSKIVDRDTTGTLSARLAEISGNLLLETIPRWLAGGITPQKQDHAQATYSKIIAKEDGRIDWQESAREIERMLRAFTPWPGIYTTWNGKRIKILAAYTRDTKEAGESGKVAQAGNEIAIETGKGTLLVTRLQPEGKMPMHADEFLRGYPDFIHATLG